MKIGTRQIMHQVDVSFLTVDLLSMRHCYQISYDGHSQLYFMTVDYTRCIIPKRLRASFSVQKLAGNGQKVFVGNNLVPFYLKYLNKIFLFSQPDAMDIDCQNSNAPMPILEQFLEFLCETYLYADLSECYCFLQVH